jgi:hypothetical protein
LVAFKYTTRTGRAWCRIRDRPARYINNGPTPATRSSVNGDLEAPAPATSTTSSDRHELLLSPRSELPTGNVGKSLLVALFPFTIISAIIGVWFGFQIGAVASILSYNNTMEKW